LFSGAAEGLIAHAICADTCDECQICQIEEQQLWTSFTAMASCMPGACRHDEVNDGAQRGGIDSRRQVEQVASPIALAQ
jgi:hypothetical protein